MRRRALQHNPRVIVALEWIEDWNYEFDGWRPIGWLSLHPVGALHKRHRYIQTFVADKARRRGLGSRMMVLCKRQWLRSSETVMVSVAQSKAAATFYKKNGFT